MQITQLFGVLCLSVLIHGLTSSGRVDAAKFSGGDPTVRPDPVVVDGEVKGNCEGYADQYTCEGTDGLPCVSSKPIISMYRAEAKQDEKLKLWQRDKQGTTDGCRGRNCIGIPAYQPAVTGCLAVP